MKIRIDKRDLDLIIMQLKTARNEIEGVIADLKVISGMAGNQHERQLIENCIARLRKALEG